MSEATRIDGRPEDASVLRRARVSLMDLLWVGWRQHRLLILVTAGLVATEVIALLWAESLLPSIPCLDDAACWHDSRGSVGPMTTLLWVSLGLPALVAVFWGAPLVAREYEQRTHMLAWSQDVPPVRWLLVRFAFLAGVGALLAVALVTASRLALTTLEHANVGGDGFNGPWDTHRFEATVPLTVGYVFAGLAIGTAAGAVLRRIVPAMGVALAAFIGVRYALQQVRPHYLPAQTLDVPMSDRGGLFGTDPGALILGRVLVDAGGRTLEWSDVPVRCDMAESSDEVLACYREAGIAAERISYRSSGSVDLFQLIETGIVVALAVIALLIAVYAVRRQRTLC